MLTAIKFWFAKVIVDVIIFFGILALLAIGCIFYIYYQAYQEKKWMKRKMEAGDNKKRYQYRI